MSLPMEAEEHAVNLTPKEMALIALGLATLAMIKGQSKTPEGTALCLDSLDILDKFHPYMGDGESAVKRAKMETVRKSLREKIKNGELK